MSHDNLSIGLLYKGQDAYEMAQKGETFIGRFQGHVMTRVYLGLGSVACSAKAVQFVAMAALNGLRATARLFRNQDANRAFFATCFSVIGSMGLALASALGILIPGKTFSLLKNYEVIKAEPTAYEDSASTPCVCYPCECV